MNTGLQDRLAQRSLARKLVQDSADLVARARETVADCRNTCYTISLQRTLAQMLAERQAKP
ncbi:MAG TPA: hypothetical protein VEQ87_15470 [Burkholderiales bacterium]|nr:hypothetical protein [Burkholderiales bacterium]